MKEGKGEKKCVIGASSAGSKGLQKVSERQATTRIENAFHKTSLRSLFQQDFFSQTEESSSPTRELTRKQQAHKIYTYFCGHIANLSFYSKETKKAVGILQNPPQVSESHSQEGGEHP